jgi:hypothetical protein
MNWNCYCKIAYRNKVAIRSKDCTSLEAQHKVQCVPLELTEVNRLFHPVEVWEQEGSSNLNLARTSGLSGVKRDRWIRQADEVLLFVCVCSLAERVMIVVPMRVFGSLLNFASIQFFWMIWWRLHCLKSNN